MDLSDPTFDDPPRNPFASVVVDTAWRLVWLLVGIGVVLLVGSIAPLWVAIAVLIAWYLPLLILVALHKFATLSLLFWACAFCGLKACKPILGPFLLGMVEELLVVTTAAMLVGWLLQ